MRMLGRRRRLLWVGRGGARWAGPRGPAPALARFPKTLGSLRRRPYPVFPPPAPVQSSRAEVWARGRRGRKMAAGAAEQARRGPGAA